MARVQLTDDAKDDLRNLDGSAQKLVLRAIKKLEEEPDKRGAPLGSRKDSNLTGFRKLVVGDRAYRIVYRVERDTVVIIWVIAKRSDDECYHLATSRLQLASQDVELHEQMKQMIDTVWAATQR